MGSMKVSIARHAPACMHVLALLVCLSLQGCEVPSLGAKPPPPLEKVDCDTAVKLVCIAVTGTREEAKAEKESSDDLSKLDFCPEANTPPGEAKKIRDKLEVQCHASCEEFEGAKDESQISKLMKCVEEVFGVREKGEVTEEEEQKELENQQSPSDTTLIPGATTSPSPEDHSQEASEDGATTSPSPEDLPSEDASKAKKKRKKKKKAKKAQKEEQSTTDEESTGTSAMQQDKSKDVGTQAKTNILQLLKQEHARKTANTKLLRTIGSTGVGGEIKHQYF